MVSKNNYPKWEDKERQIARCMCCEQWKPFNSFSIRKTGEGSRNTHSYCKICTANRAKIKRDENRRKHREEEERRGTKLCNLCNTEKPLSEMQPYPSTDNRKSLYLPRCKACHVEYRAQKRKASSERKIAKSQSERTGSLEGKLKYILSACKGRCKTSGMAFDLDLDWMLKHGGSGFCEASGLTFDIRDKGQTGHHKRNLLAPSLDRKDPDMGYTKDNCQIVTLGYNLAKSDGTHEEVMALARALVSIDERDIICCHTAACTG